MTDIQVVTLMPEDPALAQVEPLIDEMYEYMGRHGLLISLAPGGAGKLLRSMAASLQRTGLLVAARHEGTVHGFCYGTLRVSPEYLTDRLIGYVGHSYVREPFRGQRIGSRMFDVVADWFTTKGVSSIELQVLTGNLGGIRFWKSRGFEPELLQMRHRPRAE